MSEGTQREREREREIEIEVERERERKGGREGERERWVTSPTAVYCRQPSPVTTWPCACLDAHSEAGFRTRRCELTAQEGAGCTYMVPGTQELHILFA